MEKIVKICCLIFLLNTSLFSQDYDFKVSDDHEFVFCEGFNSKLLPSYLISEKTNTTLRADKNDLKTYHDVLKGIFKIYTPTKKYSRGELTIKLPDHFAVEDFNFYLKYKLSNPIRGDDVIKIKVGNYRFELASPIVNEKGKDGFTFIKFENQSLYINGEEFFIYFNRKFNEDKKSLMIQLDEVGAKMEIDYIAITQKNGKKVYTDEIIQSHLLDIDKLADIENQKSVQLAQDNNILLRHTLKNGKIGEEYVPVIYDSRRKVIDDFYVNGEKVEIEEYESYIKAGGYSKDVNGYTLVYQLINNSEKYYLVQFDLVAISYFSKTSKVNSFWHGEYLQKKTNREDIYKPIYFILSPKEIFKNQFVMGTKKPDNMKLILKEIKVLEDDYALRLIELLNDKPKLEELNFFLNEDAVSPYWERIKKKRQVLLEDEQKNFKEKMTKEITSKIYPSDERLFDPDFESEVNYQITNNSSLTLKIKYEVCGETLQEVIIKAKEAYSSTRKIIGVDKNDLSITILDIKKGN